MSWKPPLLSILLAFAAAISWADPVTFPDSAIGRHARDYFAAFQAGEDAMRRYMTEHADAEALKRHPVEDRVGIYRQMRGRLGDLTPLAIESADEQSLEVRAKSGQGGTVRLTFLAAEAEPHGLLGIRVEDLDAGDEGLPPAMSGPPPTDDRIVAELSAEVDSLSKAGAFSGVVLLEKGGKTLYSRAAGMADRENRRPNTIDTRFNLGSINKAFTATAVRQLAAAGKLGLDEPIAKYLADFPPAAAKLITVRMLLDHRSGIPDVLRTPGLWKHRDRVRTTADWYRLIKDQPLHFEPGTKQEYSNGGYAVLGTLIERVSGEDYYDYIREHIYRPAGMTKSDSYANDEIPADAAIGYTRNPGGLEDSAGGAARTKDGYTPIPWHFGRPSAAGGGYATAGDLVRFRQAVRSGKLLPADAGSELQSGGFGIAGGSPGCNALLEAAGPYTLVVLSNFDPPSAERFTRTVGPMLRRAAGAPEGLRRNRVRPTSARGS